MSSNTFSSSSPDYPHGWHSESEELNSESNSGSTDSLSDLAFWDDYLRKSNSFRSAATLPTVTSSTKSSPSHYKRGTIEVWDFIIDQDLDYLAGNCIKYICRAGYKGEETELDDWLKVQAYVNRKIQHLLSK